MTTEVVGPAPARTRVDHRAAPPLHADRANAGLAVRQIWTGALVVLVSIGLLLWLGTKAFHKSQATSGGLMEPLSTNPAVRAIYGLPTAINTVGGFAVWRVALFVTLLGTVWVTLATTRVLRGNEETGRLDLELANPLSLTEATATSLAVLFAVPVLAAVVTGSVLQATGAQAAGSWLYGVGIGLLLAGFVGVAALASQFVPERRRATGYAMGVLFATFVLRMWADGGVGAEWARWITPFGWVELLHAYGANDTLPLVPLALLPVVTAAMAFALAAERDTGAGLLRASDSKQASVRMLSSPLTFATRRRVAEFAAWGTALFVLGMLSGGLAHSLVGFPKQQPEATKILRDLGMGAAVTPGGFVAIMNVFYAVVLAGYAIACVHGDYDDELANRLDLPYANRVSRTGWAGSTVATTLVALAGLIVMLSLGTWLGAAASDSGLSVGDAFASAANVLPIAALFLGLAVLLHGVQPAWTVAVTSILAIGLYMVELIGPALSWPTWVLDLSPYHHLALVPAETAAWTALAIITGIAVVAGAAGLVGYAHRDLR